MTIGASLRALGVALLCAMTIAALPHSARAQTISEAAIADLKGPWHGTWTSAGYEYDADMTLSVDPAGKIEGAIRWTLRASPKAAENDKIGLAGTEYVRGTFRADVGLLVFEGYRRDDPNDLIGLDQYRLVVSENRRTMGGITADHGPWTGRFFLKRVEAR